MKAAIKPLAKSRHNPSARQCRKLCNDLKIRTFPVYQYTVHKAIFLSLEVLNVYLVLPNLILPVSPSSISLIWFRTLVIGNTLLNKKSLYFVTHRKPFTLVLISWYNVWIRTSSDCNHCDWISVTTPSIPLCCIGYIRLERICSNRTESNIAFMGSWQFYISRFRIFWSNLIETFALLVRYAA
jgi:hypothetical protein